MDSVFGSLRQDVVVSGDGNFEFKKIRGWLHPVFSANPSLHSVLKWPPAIFRYTGSIWSQFKEKWSLQFNNGTPYEWRVIGAGKWTVTTKTRETTLVNYESPVDYLDFHWMPKSEGKVLIAEEFRGPPEMPLIVYWGLYLIRAYRLQLLRTKGT
jgi:hypothetical protein